jgi:poly [ADP-ribose] polymerase
MSELASKKVAELRALAKELGFDTSGTKAQLIARIEGSDDVAPPAAAAAAAPKKKAPAKKSAKKKKEEEEEEHDDDDEEAKEVSAKAPKAAKSGGGGKTAHETRRIAVDRGVTLANASVYPGYGVMLNQTNLTGGNNNNKFYVIQLLESGGSYAVWNRWGRVGEHGASALKSGLSLDAAKKEFAKKFRDKTKNVWSDTIRDTFKAQPGKYTLLDMREDDEEEEKKVAVKHVNKESKLDPAVQVCSNWRICNLCESVLCAGLCSQHLQLCDWKFEKEH